MSDNGPFTSDEGGTTVVADFFSELFGEGGLDAVWLDLDGDEVPDIQISAYDAQTDDAADGTADDIFELPADGSGVDDDSSTLDDVDVYPADDGDVDTYEVPGDESYDDGYDDLADSDDYDSWISIPTEDDGLPLYDVTELIPNQSVPYADWTDPGANGYDPLAMSNYSVDAGPVIFDATSGDPYCATDYTSTALWYNVAPFDDGAGYWDPTYAVMPTEPDMSLWQAAPESYSPSVFADPYALPTYSDPTSIYADYAYDSTPAFDYTSDYSVPGYESTDFTSWDSSTATDTATSYFMDSTFDDQLSTAADNSQFWRTEYNDASELSNDYWQMSVDAYLADDDALAYDYNQLSLEANSYADDAWSYSNSAWDSVSTTDDGWSDSSSLDY